MLVSRFHPVGPSCFIRLLVAKLYLLAVRDGLVGFSGHFWASSVGWKAVFV